MSKITTHLWFDKQAKAAADFYISVFPESKIINSSVLKGTPSGDTDVVNMEVWGHRIGMISAGPYFQLNPSISYMANFDSSKMSNAREKLDEIWDKLADGGKVLMALDKYPFSERYGWIQDKYGVSWQLILTNPAGEPRPAIIPSMLFVGNVCGKADEAINFYTSVFKDSKRGMTARYPAGMPEDKEGTIMFADFMLEGSWFAAMDSAQDHKFAFNEAFSLMVECDTQEEIDYYWSRLSAVPEAEQCGWLKDKFGVSWQITPKKLDEFLSTADEATKQRVTEAFLKMKKFDLAALERAAKGE
jgi:predicted 3-demethylubiquinone-9 3-methyltransferase (glyoxalase superfamily)